MFFPIVDHYIWWSTTKNQQSNIFKYWLKFSVHSLYLRVFFCVSEFGFSLTFWFPCWCCCFCPRVIQTHSPFFLCSNFQNISHNLKTKPRRVAPEWNKCNEIVRMNMSLWKLHKTMDFWDLGGCYVRGAEGMGSWCLSQSGHSAVAAEWMNVWINMNYKIRKAMTQRALVDFLLVHCQGSLTQTLLL